MATLRDDLEPPPERIARLPIDDRGYPIPWFVPVIDGQPEFRAMDARKLRRACVDRLCWTCGRQLGKWLAFPIGPMCAITRTTAEPPSHRDCAEWSIRNCPFLSNPRMERRHDHKPDGMTEGAGLPILRNPGVVCLWICRSFERFNDGKGGVLFTVGTPESVTFYREKRLATLAEVMDSIDSGLPILMTAARHDGPLAVEQLGRQLDFVKRFLPQEITT